jgi:hypothetical protein
MAEYVKLPEMWEVFFELIPYAQMRIRGERVIIRMTDVRKGSTPDTPPLLLVDGVVTTDSRDAAALDPLKMERIELVNMEYCYGALKFSGIISFISQEGNCPVDYPSCFFRQAYEFLSNSSDPEFPSYGDQIAGPEPDFRNTLYWSPSVRTKASGSASVEFYTSDECSDYTIMITGLNDNGQTGSYSGTLTVE